MHAVGFHFCEVLEQEELTRGRKLDLSDMEVGTAQRETGGNFLG